ncbi:hypothetical protein [Agarilytica rhodophyticola]|uniref:hypothetical protein n=1 Tax=Agarilytica rhodophyticola TaxID=1737490 RepID=UPI000B347A88|nr:hypothetical protein [Agarilytica rhodophyticola]
MKKEFEKNVNWRELAFEEKTRYLVERHTSLLKDKIKTIVGTYDQDLKEELAQAFKLRSKKGGLSEEERHILENVDGKATMTINMEVPVDIGLLLYALQADIAEKHPDYTIADFLSAKVTSKAELFYGDQENPEEGALETGELLVKLEEAVLKQAAIDLEEPKYGKDIRLG